MSRTIYSKNPALQSVIETNVNITEACNRISSMATTPQHRLQSDKTCFVANLRLLNCMRQLQLEKAQEIIMRTTKNQPAEVETTTIEKRPQSLAHLHICKIRIPLIWRESSLFDRAYPAMLPSVASSKEFKTNMPLLYTNSFNLATCDPVYNSTANAGDTTLQNSFALFCLLQIGSDIIDTQLITDVKPGFVDVSFDDDILFEEVKSDFIGVLEVYGASMSSVAGAQSTTTGHGNCPSSFPGKMSHCKNVFAKSHYQALIDRVADINLLSTQGASVSNGPFHLIARALFTQADLTYAHGQRVLMLDMGPRLHYGRWPDDLPGDQAKYDFSIGDPAAANWPLFGAVFVSPQAELASIRRPMKEGQAFVNRFSAQPTKSNTAPARYRVVLRNRCLRCYAYAKQVNGVEVKLRNKQRRSGVNSVIINSPLRQQATINAISSNLASPSRPLPDKDVEEEDKCLIYIPIDTETILLDEEPYAVNSASRSSTPDSGHASAVESSSSGSSTTWGSSCMTRPMAAFRLAVQHNLTEPYPPPALTHHHQHPPHNERNNTPSYKKETFVEILLPSMQEAQAWLDAIKFHMDELDEWPCQALQEYCSSKDKKPVDRIVANRVTSMYFENRPLPHSIMI